MEVQSEVRERPILFSGPMVKAILEGKKTQTRRVMKDQPNFDWSPTVGFYSPTVTDKNGNEKPGAEVYGASDESFGRKCPYGKPGDRLWVRETWGLFDTEPKDGPERAHIYYRASDENLHECRYQLWRPSIHMPRWASRITLEITDIRVQRLLEIIPADVIAEGCPYKYSGTDPENAPDWTGWYRNLWDSINGKRGQCKTCKGHGVVPAWSGSVNGGSLAQDSKDCPDCKGDDRGYGWDANPWIWAISFQKVN